MLMPLLKLCKLPFMIVWHSRPRIDHDIRKNVFINHPGMSLTAMHWPRLPQKLFGNVSLLNLHNKIPSS